MANTASVNLVLRFCDGRVEFAEVLFQGRDKNTCAATRSDGPKTSFKKVGLTGPLNKAQLLIYSDSSHLLGLYNFLWLMRNVMSI